MPAISLQSVVVVVAVVAVFQLLLESVRTARYLNQKGMLSWNRSPSFEQLDYSQNL